MIAASFFAVGAPAALLVGYLCDKVNRRDMLFVVVILGEPCDLEPCDLALASCLNSTSSQHDTNCGLLLEWPDRVSLSAHQIPSRCGTTVGEQVCQHLSYLGFVAGSLPRFPA